MDVDAQVLSLIQWSEQHFPFRSEIPKINIEDPPAWKEMRGDAYFIAVDHRESLLACFMGYMTDDPLNIPARFTALSIYYALSGRDLHTYDELLEFVASQEGLDSTELEMGRSGDFNKYEEAAKKCETLALKLIEGFNEDLSLVIHQLKPEDVPDEWRVIRWEILNSYAIGDWERAVRLYNRVEDLRLLDLAEVRALRGQFEYLRVFGPKIELKLETLYWEPKIYGPTDQELTLVLLHSGLLPPTPESDLNDLDRQFLTDASNDLETALNLNPGLGPVYQSLLARTFVATGHFHDGADRYQQVLTFRGLDSVPEWKRMAYECLASSYTFANEAEKAIEVLTRYSGEFPQDSGIQKKLAELYANEADYKSAFECLQKAAEINPRLEEDVGVRIALALGDIYRPNKDGLDLPTQLLQANPELAMLVKALLSTHWQKFEKLATQVQGEWEAAVLDLYYLGEKEPGLRARWNEDATKHFAKALELELKARIFDLFRQEFGARTSTLSTFSIKPDTPAWLRYFDSFLFKNGKLNLEKMVQILKRCSTSEELIAKNFFAWLSRNCPLLLTDPYMDALMKTLKPRGDATHENMPPEQAQSVASFCKKLLDILVS